MELTGYIGPKKIYFSLAPYGLVYLVRAHERHRATALHL